MTALAFIEPLACVGRHGLELDVAAVGASQQGLKYWFGHSGIIVAIIQQSGEPISVASLSSHGSDHPRAVYADPQRGTILSVRTSQQQLDQIRQTPLHPAEKESPDCSVQPLGHLRRITCSSKMSGAPTSRSMISGANRVNRMTRRTCVTSMPSAVAISATDAARPSFSSRCQWCARPSARTKGVSYAAT